MPSLKLQELLRAARVGAGFAPEATAGGGGAASAAAGAMRLAGLTPEAKAFWIAGEATNYPRNDVTVVVVPSDRDVDQIVSDVRFFLGGLEGASSDELEHTLLPFPSQEVDPYRGLAPHLRIASIRARALHVFATD